MAMALLSSSVDVVVVSAVVVGWGCGGRVVVRVCGWLGGAALPVGLCLALPSFARPGSALLRVVARLRRWWRCWRRRRAAGWVGGEGTAKKKKSLSLAIRGNGVKLLDF